MGSTGGPIRLELEVVDQDVLAALRSQPDLSAMSAFALQALKVGVLAIRQASGTLDSRTIQQEADSLLANLRTTLIEQTGTVKAVLGSYFDPASGMFQNRLDRLVGRDGDLEKAIQDHLTGDDSALGRMLRDHIGENSPLLQRFSLDERSGILSAMRERLQDVLQSHARSVVEEFSLDKPDSALNRMLGTLTDRNGKLREELAGDLGKVRDEFSLDKEDSALSRLMGQITNANLKIRQEFSLDNREGALSRLAMLLEGTRKAVHDNLTIDREDSPLARLRRELSGLIADMAKSQGEFQQKVGETLATLSTRRQSERRSTAHGVTFEGEVGEFVGGIARDLGDQFSPVGNNPGSIPRCKKGDFVIRLSDDSAAPGSRIVVEAKGDKGYSLDDAFQELDLARQNREADAGVLVFETSAAPAGMQPIERRGLDLAVRWDPEDAGTDIVLRTATLVSRFLVVARRREDAENSLELGKMARSVSALLRGITHLEAILTSGNTIQNGAERVLKEAKKCKDLHEEELGKLREQLLGMGATGIGLEGPSTPMGKPGKQTGRLKPPLPEKGEQGQDPMDGSGTGAGANEAGSPDEGHLKDGEDSGDPEEWQRYLRRLTEEE